MAGKEYSLKAILSATDRISPVLKKVDSNIGKVGRSFSSFAKASVSLASKLALPLTALGGVGGFSLKAAVDKFTSLGDSIDKASKRAGVGVESLQKLRYAAGLGGMSADQMDQALSKLTDNMGKAARGENKNLAAIFKRLGISLKDSKGQIRDAADVMRNLSPAVRMRILTAAFGEELSKRMIPVLEGGAKSLDDMGEQASKLGLVMDQDMVAKSAHLTDTLSTFSQVVDGVSAQVGAALAPTIEGIVIRMQDWLVANKDLIAQRLDGLFEKVSKAIAEVDFEKVVDGVFDFIDGVMEFVDSVGGWENIIKGFGALLGVSLVGDLLSVGKELYGVGAAVTAAFGPWGLLAGAAIGAGIAIWKNWDEILAKFDASFPNLSKALSDIPGNFTRGWDDATKQIKELWDGLVKRWESVKNTLSWGNIKGNLREMVGLSRTEAPEPAATPTLNASDIAAISQRTQNPQASEVDNRLEVTLKLPQGFSAAVDKVDSNGGSMRATTQNYSFIGVDQ
mgnify:CR=1 FL=1